MPVSPITPITVAPDLAEQAYQSILAAICDGRLAPGERITQERLAESLSVSRQPVLQALLLLKRDGFVAEAGNRGIMVAPLTSEHIVNLYQVRSVLDGLAAREAARRKADLSPALLAAGRRAAAEKTVSAMIDADLSFHRAIYGAAGNPLLLQTAERHWSHIRRVMGAVLQRADTRAAIWDEHESMLAAIVRGEADRAQQLALDHCEVAGENLARQLDFQQGTGVRPADAAFAAPASPPQSNSAPDRTPDAEPGRQAASPVPAAAEPATDEPTKRTRRQA
jgi:DNA-binding GntR family transcriptional regulator